MGAVSTMAKRKAKPADAVDGSESGSGRGDQVRIIVTSAFKSWLEKYAESRQLTMTDTIVQDLIRGAKIEGFDPPPKR